jgi:hypothetical protein
MARDTPVFTTNKIDNNEITAILFNVALSTIIHTLINSVSINIRKTSGSTDIYYVAKHK